MSRHRGSDSHQSSATCDNVSNINTVEHENLAALKFSILKMWVNFVHVKLAILDENIFHL